MSFPMSSDVWHWRQRAVEFRTLASTIEGDEARETMLRIASHYDQLAKRAEQRVEKSRQAIMANAPKSAHPEPQHKPLIFSAPG